MHGLCRKAKEKSCAAVKIWAVSVKGYFLFYKYGTVLTASMTSCDVNDVKQLGVMQLCILTCISRRKRQSLGFYLNCETQGLQIKRAHSPHWNVLLQFRGSWSPSTGRQMQVPRQGCSSLCLAETISLVLMAFLLLLTSEIRTVSSCKMATCWGSCSLIACI